LQTSKEAKKSIIIISTLPPTSTKKVGAGGGDRVLILERAAQSKVNKFQYLFFVVFAVRTLETTT